MDKILLKPDPLAPDALVVLKKMAERKDHQGFAHMARGIEWSRYRPTDLIQAIDLALALDMVQMARELAQTGRQLFPQNERIRCAAVVLSPPVVLETRPSQTHDIEVSHRWMREHSSQYKGQWVAVRGGTFLGSAPTLNALYQHIGLARHDANAIVVRVLG